MVIHNLKSKCYDTTFVIYFLSTLIIPRCAKSRVGLRNSYQTLIYFTRWFADGAPTPSKGGMIATSDQVKRMVSDAYMCFYQSTEVMMYQ